MTDTAPEPFDFRKILSKSDSLGRQPRDFPELTESPNTPEFASYLRAADHVIAHHCVGRAPTPWVKAMQAYEPNALSGNEARKHWDHYLHELNILTHALASTYQGRALGEKEIAMHHARILRAWEEVGDEIAYFSETRHDLSIAHPLPNRDAFSSAIEYFYEQAMATMEAPPDAIQPKAPTKAGELRRGSTKIRQLMEEAASARRAEPPPARALLTVRRSKPEAERVKLAIGMVEDPVSQQSWYPALKKSIAARGNFLKKHLSDELLEVTLSALSNAEQQLDGALSNYTSVVCHNFHHPEDIKEETHAFDAINDAVQHLRTQLPTDMDRLPNRAQFASLQEAMKNAALTVLNTPDIGFNSPSKRNGGGPGGFPGGWR